MSNSKRPSKVVAVPGDGESSTRARMVASRAHRTGPHGTARDRSIAVITAPACQGVADKRLRTAPTAGGLFAKARIQRGAANVVKVGPQPGETPPVR